MRTVSVYVAPILGFSVVFSQDAYDVLVLEVVVDSGKVAAVQTGVRDHHHNTLSGVAGFVGGIDVHQLAGSGDIVHEFLGGLGFDGQNAA